MKAFFPATSAFLILLTTASMAQAPADNTAILKAIQKHLDRLDQRMERLEKKVDNLPAADPASAASPASSPVRKAGPQYATVKGWQVDVIPADNDTKDPVATFNWDKPEFNFGLHTKLVSSHDPFTYRGTAKFYPDQKARYVFQLILEPLRDNRSNYFRCMGNIKIGNDVIATGRATSGNVNGNWDRNGELFGSAMFSGGTELEPPPDPSRGYVLTFQVSCYLDDQDHAQLPDSAFKNWSDNRFSVLVKGPDDASGRAFAGDELYHAGKIKAAR